MALFYLHELASNTWRGPFEDAAIRQDVTNGHIEPGRLVWSGHAADAPLAASSIAVPVKPGVPNWLKCVGAALGILGSAWFISKALEPTTSPRPSRSRRPDVQPPPADPEWVAIHQSAERHARNGADVRADIAGWPRPPVLDGRIPDVHAHYGDRVEIEEYENERSVVRTHAAEQHATFTRWANRSYRREYTQFLVPGGRGGHG